MNTTMRAWTLRAAALAAVLLLAGCGGGGAKTVENPVTSGGTPAAYSGPPPATADIQAFKINVWDNLRATNRCGSCHVAGGQAPQFVRSDDINLAYAAANTVVNLASPRDSRMVQKVAGGHNCWLASPAACADILTTWISNWAGTAAGGGTSGITLTAPPLRDPGASKAFPASPALFSTTVYPVVRQYCSRCHAPAAASPQAPYFASADLNEAYAAVKVKIDLDRPEQSRLVVRLRSEFHNCWSNCAADADEMEAAIRAFADQVPATQVDPSLVLSKALGMYDGIVASGGNRYTANLVGLWEFKTGKGTVAYDTSGVDPALNLTLSGDVTWVGGWGINVKSGKAQGSTTASRKLTTLISATGEYSIEAWVAPGNVAQEDARIVSYSGGTTTRNFMLGQTLYSYDFYNRSTSTGPNGDPKLTTAAADEDLQATLQHVVVTYDPVNGRRVYVNGQSTGDVDPVSAGTIANWDDTFAFVLGNEVSGDRQFQGVFRLVAVYNRALTQEQVRTNYAAGVGEKYYVLFSVSHLVNVPQSYIMFEVSQYDSYSYLFNKPTFISLDPAARPGTIPIKGMRIGENGTEPDVGQAYRTLDTSITDSNYGPLGQPLSSIGTVIPLQKGPDSDEFFLTFDVLGSHSNVRLDPVPLAPPPLPDVRRPADIGLRAFDRINATMSVLTGVSTQAPGVKSTFDTVRQSLPAVASVDTFASAHPVAIAQMSIQYCNSLVDDTTARAQYFPGFNFNAAPATAFDPTGRAIVLDSLVTHMMRANLATEPDPTAVRGDLDALITRLTACGSSCPAGRTPTVVKATCAALLGSAVTLIE
ncbi:MAG TPA: LamG domain-containing protein [Steroidobacteraceae bacterium]|nr:LamG domain-containing protein [Steroidobacteraceae bacterium]